nr:hypothetical protein [Anaerolineae bacterium]
CQACGFDLARARNGMAHAPTAHVPGQHEPAEGAQPEGEEPATRDAGLPPWLDSVERAALGSAPRRAALDDLVDLEAERLEALPRPGGWSPEAIPIEPIVGVPYRAYERAQLPATPEQGHAAALFGQAAAEEVQADPRDVPEPRRASGLRPWPRRLLALALLAALLVPTLWPGGVLGAATASASAAAAAATIDALPPGAPVLVAFEYDAGIAGDLQPAAEAYLRHLLNHGARLILVSTQPEGAALAGMALDRVLPAYPEARSGESVVHLGYVAGGDAAVRALTLRIAGRAGADYRTGTPLGEAPLLQGIGGARQLPLIVVLGGDLTLLRRWIEQAAAPYSVPLVAGVPMQVAPALEPYWTAGQLRGVVAGVSGAAAYEQLTLSPAPAARSVAALRVGVWAVAAAVVLGNLWTFVDWIRRRRSRDA